jgi:hypothetical protein
LDPEFETGLLVYLKLVNGVGHNIVNFAKLIPSKELNYQAVQAVLYSVGRSDFSNIVCPANTFFDFGS